MHYNVYTLDTAPAEESTIKGLSSIARAIHEQSLEIRGEFKNISLQQTTKIMAPFMSDNSEKDAAWNIAPSILRDIVTDYLKTRDTIDLLDGKSYKINGAQMIANSEQVLLNQLDFNMQNSALNEDQRKEVSQRVKAAVMAVMPSPSSPSR